MSSCMTASGTPGRYRKPLDAVQIERRRGLRRLRLALEALQRPPGQQLAHLVLGRSAHALAQHREREVQIDLERVGGARAAAAEVLEAPAADELLHAAAGAGP